MTKSIKIQTQPVMVGRISDTKEIGWCAIYVDGVKLIFDAYNGSGPSATPRIDSLVEIVTDRDIFHLTPEYLVAAVAFFQKYNEMGSDVVRFKNMFQVTIPDRFRDAQMNAKIGLKI